MCIYVYIYVYAVYTSASRSIFSFLSRTSYVRINPMPRLMIFRPTMLAYWTQLRQIPGLVVRPRPAAAAADQAHL